MDEPMSTQCFMSSQSSCPEEEENEEPCSQDAVCRLISLADARISASIAIGSALAIGRSHEEAEGGSELLVLVDEERIPPAVSNKHALLHYTGDGGVTLDVLSVNGFTFVNEKACDPLPAYPTLAIITCRPSTPLPSRCIAIISLGSAMTHRHPTCPFCYRHTSPGRWAAPRGCPCTTATSFASAEAGRTPSDTTNSCSESRCRRRAAPFQLLKGRKG